MPKLRGGAWKRNSGGARVPLKISIDESDEARIGSRITVQPDGCWLYNDDRDPDQHASTDTGKRSFVVHRFVYETLVGPIPPSHHLHHECEIPRCCNPAHCVPLTPLEHKARHREMAKR